MAIAQMLKSLAGSYFQHAPVKVDGSQSLLTWGARHGALVIDDI